MRILFIGDIVGPPGRKFVQQAIPILREREGVDLIVANAENVDAGSGLTPSQYRQLIRSGLDCITMGDHVYRRKEIFGVMKNETNIVKPANFPPEAPGRDWTQVDAADGTPIAVISLMGRVFMRPVDCPFRAVDRVLKEIPPQTKVVLVDFHAEATGDKQLMGRYLDGRVSAVLGTHTHVPTADERILPHGTAFQCDVGMTGPLESILGRRIDRVTETTLTFRPTPFDVAEEDVHLQGAIVDIDPATGKALAIRRLDLRKNEIEPVAAITSETGGKNGA